MTGTAQQALSEIATRAIRQVSAGSHHDDAGGWSVLGVDRAFLEHAARNALDDQDRRQLMNGAVSSRLGSLLRGGTDPRILPMLPADLHAAMARRLVEERLVLMRTRRAFIDWGPLIRPLHLQMLRHSGVDAAVACMIAAAGRTRTSLPGRFGISNIAAVDRTHPATSVDSELRVGVALSPDIRFTVQQDMGVWLVTPPIPESVTAHLPGRSVTAVVRHPALSCHIAIDEVMRLGDLDPASDQPDRTAILLSVSETPRRYDGCAPDAFAPITG